MNEWEIAAVVLTGAVLPCIGVCLLASASSALPAIEVAGTVTVTVLMALAEGFHRQPFVDLALVLTLVSVVGALTFARIMESDL
jgi:multisubunit Na+/H+ antiporter MnhF subunit